jgi:NTP pyrophosphatase (non-canonical NTP hydrolase)
MTKMRLSKLLFLSHTNLHGQDVITKYTTYSQTTGITKENHCSFFSDELLIVEQTGEMPHLLLVLTETATEAFDFAVARNWLHYDLPLNLALAILAEIGELAEKVQWKKPEPVVVAKNELHELAQEVADVAIYTLRFTVACNLMKTVEACGIVD